MTSSSSKTTLRWTSVDFITVTPGVTLLANGDVVLPAMASTRVIVPAAMDAVFLLHYARPNILVTATTGVTLLANGDVVLPAVMWAMSATPVIVLIAMDAPPPQQQRQLHSA